MAKSKRATQAANDISEAGTYLNLRQSLDSFRDLALAQYALSQTSDEKKELSGFVFKTVNNFQKQIAKKYQKNWKKWDPDRAKELENLANAASSSQCPPGFVENGQGQCVPIGMPL